MPFIDTDIEGLKLFEPRIFEDDRGYFFESYNDRIRSCKGRHSNKSILKKEEGEHPLELIEDP